MISKTLALPPQHLRIAFFSMLGVAAVAGTLNGAVALGGWAARTAPVAEPAPVVVPIQPKAEEAEPAPPPAFQFDAPLPGRVVNSPFGLRQLPWEENGRLHEGVDIAAPSGALVKAAADGVVKATGTSPTYGRYVQVMHKGGLTTLYAHLAKPAKGVKRGTYLHRGDTVAFVGNSGRSTGSHLHFEIRKGDKALNPTFFLGRSFAEASDLPLKAAGRVSRKVHLATVSKWPDGVKKGSATSGRVQMARLKNGRVRASIPVASTPVATVPAPAAQPVAAANGLAT
ncbi:M23 family metallopeptidase [Caulobacter sp. RL271]|uniref:M23 family metallopeptidase n=1 Tax=Caulobacter segnis TaxID=88688 RepID=A0ABY4ZW75_9CAUL|nr:M23 family metallopeptidase [Caulobacter segnis]USQ96821.1 M23 family metallopeptidase [Caulobacter segnis]